MKDLYIKLKYKTYEDDIIRDFYNPVLSKSKYYYRAVGYFTSSILMEYIKGLIPFLKGNGKMRLIISPVLNEDDFNELNSLDDYSVIELTVLEKINEWLNSDSILNASSKLFVQLIKNNILEVKISRPNTSGIFHEKIGIFSDYDDNMIAIIGSNNETKNATSINYESFNTFCSWKPGQDVYVIEHYNDFIKLWNNEYVNSSVIDINEAIREGILKINNTTESIDELIDMIENNEVTSRKLGFEPYVHQKVAFNKWFENRQGILKLATGAGKTKTAIMIIEKLKELYEKQLTIIVVPDKTLVNQWKDELSKYFFNIIPCFSDYNWEDELTNFSFNFQDYSKRHQAIITTNDTFFGDKFQRILERFNDDYLLIVDECHTWGTNRILECLPNPVMRLGLSATPELHFSELKTEKLLSFFGGIKYEYSIEHALRDKRLVGYRYIPIIVNLTDDEKEKYDELTSKIVRLIGTDVEDYFDGQGKHLEMILFNRARIVYGARRKLEVLEEIIGEVEKKGKLLIYCGPTSYSSSIDGGIETESLSQLQAVNQILKRKNLKFAQYTSQEDDYERKLAIDFFKKQTYSTLVAIKCLDEGVDIPIIENAIILASSTNPREFIQRRGRILRHYPGKTEALIYDFIVYEDQYEGLLKKELDRFYEFSRLSINFDELKAKFSHLYELYTRLKTI